jgi:hypothetical protein
MRFEENPSHEHGTKQKTLTALKNATSEKPKGWFRALCVTIIFTVFFHVDYAHGQNYAHGQKTPFSPDQFRKGDILITPLLDLRDPKTKIEPNKKIDFPPPRERTIYAEALGKVLFPSSETHRIHTSGLEFDEINKLKNLPDLARKLHAGTPLSTAWASKISSILPDFQYLIFFSFTNEKLAHQHSRTVPTYADGYLVENIYTTQREMTVKVAIWDIQNHQLAHWDEINGLAQVDSSVFVKTEKKTSAYKFTPPNYGRAINPDMLDKKPTVSLEEELKVHRHRFPPPPEREPELSNALKRFNSTTSAKNEVEQPKTSRPQRQTTDFEDNFRMELSLKATMMGTLPLPTLYIGAATLKWKILRIGGGLEFSPLGTMIDHELRLYDVYNGCLCLTADVEWQFGNKNRILTGLYYGAGIFTYNQSDLLPDLDGTKSKSQSDGYIYRAPRVRYLRGDHKGLQFGLGVYQHIYDKIDKPELIANHPGQYGIEFTVAVATGG